MKNEYDRTQYITLLNVLSALAVVCLHTNGCFWAFSKEKYWFSANIIECVCYFAVPVFFMISGATLMDYQERYPTKIFIRKRIKKVLIPFVAWSFVGLLYNLILARFTVSDIDVKFVVNGILNSSFNSIYWFFPSLFCVYLCIPVLASIEKDRKKSIFSYLAIAGFIVNFLVPFMKNIFAIDLAWPFYIEVEGGFLIYVVIGYLLKNHKTSSGITVMIYMLSMVGLLMHIIGTYKLSMEAGSIVQTYKGYLNIPCILYSVGVFLFFKNHGNAIMESFAGRFIRFFAKYTFSIYLAHYYIMECIRVCLFEGFLKVDVTSTIYRLSSPFIVVIVTVATVHMMKKVPILKNIVPE